MWAILSDVHANLEALQAVLSDIDRHRPSRLLCLGDVLGYGPDPVACVDLIRQRCEVAVLGNFDQAGLFDELPGFAPPAERAILWHRAEMDRIGKPWEREARWEWLADRPRTHHEGPWLFLHGSPRNSLNEYVFPEDIYNERKMTRIFDLMEHICFCGHTHVPGVFLDQAAGFDVKTARPLPVVGARSWHFVAPEEGAYRFQITHHTTMINVGSVGQPRDGDWRACYVLFDGGSVTFRRVEYDVDTTVQKIYAIPELGNFLGDRLRDGR